MKTTTILVLLLATLAGCYRTPTVGEEWQPVPLYEAQDDDDSAS